MKYPKDTTLYTTKDIGRMVYRSDIAVASMALRLNILPDKIEFIAGSVKKNLYSAEKVNLIVERYDKLDNSFTVKKGKIKTPDVIYVNRTNFIYESKSNYYSQKKIEKLTLKYN